LHPYPRIVAVSDRVVAQFAEHFTGLPGGIAYRQVLSLLGMERLWGITDGRALHETQATLRSSSCARSEPTPTIGHRRTDCAFAERGHTPAAG
jgi:hypothetical protein